MRLSCGENRNSHVHVHTCLSLSFFSVKTCSYVCFTNVYEGICFLLVHFQVMSMHDSCQHTRAHTCRDHSHTLELRWWRVWRWFALTQSSYKHTYKHTYKWVRVYIFVLCLFTCLSIHTTAVLPNPLFVHDTGSFFWATTRCRSCHPTFLPGFHRSSECVFLVAV